MAFEELKLRDEALGGVERLVDQPVGERVVLATDVGVRDHPDLARRFRRFNMELS